MLLKAKWYSLIWSESFSKLCDGVQSVKDSGGRKEYLEQVGRMDPEAKVIMSIDMTEAMVGACVEGIRAQDPTITEEELMKKLGERLRYSKRLQGRGGPVK